MRLTISQIGEILGGSQPRGDALALRAAIDSRAVRQGDLFVCIPGERADGHDFARMAAASGAAAILASKPVPDVDIPVFIVPDTTEALGRLAAAARDGFKGKVICLTGTAGKTTLKDTLAAILSCAGKTAATEKNHNNQLGLPLAILAAEGDERFLVLEAGINHPGDMEYLGGIARPDLAIILNVGPGHTEGLGDKGVAWNKTRLLTFLKRGGEALVSADYPDLAAEAIQTKARVHFFSLRDEKAEFHALNPPADGSYVLKLAQNSCAVETPFLGEYGAETALCAAAAAHMLGCGCGDIKNGFANLRLPPQRFNRIEKCGKHIFDSTYNANPLSMSRMLGAAAAYAEKNGMPFVAVLGEMGELGEEAALWHRKLGALLAKLRPLAVFWKGGHYENVKSGLGSSGAPLVAVDEPAQFVEAFNECPATRSLDACVVLFQGSRSNRMEKLLEEFMNHCGEGRENVL